MGGKLIMGYELERSEKLECAIENIMHCVSRKDRRKNFACFLYKEMMYENEDAFSFL